MDPVTRLPVPNQPLSPEEQLELEESMARHPAGKGRMATGAAPDLSRCPTCGTRPSGALGDPALSI